MRHLRRGDPLAGPGSRAPHRASFRVSALAGVDPYRGDRQSMLKTLYSTRHTERLSGAPTMGRAATARLRDERSAYWYSPTAWRWKTRASSSMCSTTSSTCGYTCAGATTKGRTTAMRRCRWCCRSRSARTSAHSCSSRPTPDTATSEGRWPTSPSLMIAS